jgi:hypothetical protein
MTTADDRTGDGSARTETAETASASALDALIRHAALPDGAATEHIGPLLDSYVSRIRSRPPAELLDAEPAIVFDASWDEE